MAKKSYITYLSPKADESSYDWHDIKVMWVSGVVHFMDGFIVLFDSKKDLDNFFPTNRVFMVERVLSSQEKIDLLSEQKSFLTGTVYYHRLEIDYGQEPGDEFIVRHGRPGKRPFGMNCKIRYVGEHWTCMYDEDFVNEIIIPTKRIIGMTQMRFADHE